MVQITLGDALTAEKVFSGENDHGRYEMLKLSDGKSRGKKITIFASNPGTGLKDGGSFAVKKISDVKYTSRKYKDQWYDEVQVEAEISPLRSAVGNAMDVSADDFNDMPPFPSDADDPFSGLLEDDGLPL